MFNQVRYRHFPGIDSRPNSRPNSLYNIICTTFDLEKLSNYADDNYFVRWNLCIKSLIVEMKKSLEAITMWLRDLGLKVNKTNTEM